jgi:hypothetical protein
LYYPKDRQTGKAAKAICRTCPVQLDCLIDNLSEPEFGVFGGASLEERRIFRRALPNSTHPEDRRSPR